MSVSARLSGYSSIFRPAIRLGALTVFAYFAEVPSSRAATVWFDVDVNNSPASLGTAASNGAYTWQTTYNTGNSSAWNTSSGGGKQSEGGWTNGDVAAFNVGTATYSVNITTAGVTIGGLTVSAGNVTISSSGSGTLALAAASIFDVAASSSLTISTALSGGFGLSKTSAGTLTFSNSNSYTGATTISAGTLALSGSGSIAASSGVANSATFDISATTSGASIQSLTGAGGTTLGSKTLTLTNASGTYSGVLSGTGGALTLSTAGTATLTGTNTYTGATTIGSSTTLALSGSGSVATSSGVANSGTFDISATTSGASIKSYSGAGTTTLGAQTLTITNAAGAYSGGISGTGGVILSAGTQTLSGTKNYSGGTTVNGGTLTVSGTNTNIGNISVSGGSSILQFGSAINTASATVSLTSGGKIQLTSAVNLTLGVLSVSTGTLDFGAGLGASTITFGNVNTTSWSSLVVSNYNPGSDHLFFGTGSTIDTSKFNFGAGWTATFNSGTGELTAIPEPATTAVLLGLGILGFGGYRRWRSRSAAIGAAAA